MNVGDINGITFLFFTIDYFLAILLLAHWWGIQCDRHEEQQRRTKQRIDEIARHRAVSRAYRDMETDPATHGIAKVRR